MRVPLAPLRSALKTAAGAKGSHGIQSGVRLEATDHGLTATCTDYNATISAKVRIEDPIPGVAIVDASLAQRLTSAMAGEHVDIEMGPDTLALTVGETAAELRCMPVDLWPRIEQPDAEPVTLSAQDVERIARIVPLASRDLKRKALWGVRLQGTEAIATDSYRLGITQLDVEVPGCTIPASALAQMVRNADEATLTVSSRLVRWDSGDIAITTTLVHDDYPDIARAVPTDRPHHLTVSCDEAVAAIKRVAALGDTDDYNYAFITLRPDGGKIQLESVHRELGRVVDVISCEGSWPEPVHFNASYLAQLITIAGVSGESVTLEVHDPYKAVTAVSEGLIQALVPTRVMSTSKAKK